MEDLTAACGPRPVSDHPVILFDGVCNLCHWAVRFVIRRDRAAVFRFAAQQSDAGGSLLAMAGEPASGSGDSVILIERGVVHRRSTAALRIARRMRFPWTLMYGLIIVPRSLRDRGYDFIAQNRYRWFGRQETCLVPSEELRARFLE